MKKQTNQQTKTTPSVVLTTPAALVSGFTLGLDLGDRSHHVCVLDAAGEIIREGALSNTRPALARLLANFPRATVAMEAGMHSPWISRFLTELGAKEVIEASDVLLAPALFEAAGVAVGQALSRGVPVVVGPANGWAGPVARHGAGVVLGDIGALGDAVAQAAHAGPQACREAAAEVSQGRQAIELINLYERVAGDRALHAR